MIFFLVGVGDLVTLEFFDGAGLGFNWDELDLVGAGLDLIGLGLAETRVEFFWLLETDFVIFNY
jgi:hypothetical protein